MSDKNMEQAETYEWPYLVQADEITASSLRLKISPDAQQASAIARRLGLVSVDRLEAALTLKREQGGRVVHVKGGFEADIMHNCVVTMEPFPETIAEDFEAWYSDSRQAVSLARVRHEKEVKKAGAEKPVLDEREDPEPIVDGRIDVGELVVQYLSLALNPFPRAPGVEEHHPPARTEADKEVDELLRNPFAALKKWRDEMK